MTYTNDPLKRLTPRILIIAGSDSGGGAGIQADIKTVTMLGGHAMTAVTAITAQNTLGVAAVHPVPPAIVRAQIDAVASDLGIDAIKIGMLGAPGVAVVVADWLEGVTPRPPVVFDPVMVATSGATLADAATVAAFARLLRAATVATPNLPELAALGGERAILDAGCALLVKGGHGAGDTIVDRLLDRDGEAARWEDTRIATTSTHGTGCTLASGIAEGLGRGLALVDAVARARLFVRLALREAPGLGRGHGPMGHQRVRLDLEIGGATPNQITLPATDHAASLAFWRALGLHPIVADDGRYARFESAGGVTLSIEAAAGIDHRPVVFVAVADLDAAVAAARAQGITVADPVAQSWGWREARLADPAGNAVCLYSAGEMRRFPPWRLA